MVEHQGGEHAGDMIHMPHTVSAHVSSSTFVNVSEAHSGQSEGSGQDIVIPPAWTGLCLTSSLVSTLLDLHSLPS